VRPLADYLARRGLAVSVPRIAGHGTTVQDLDATGPGDWLGTAEQALADLRSRCATVFVAGISLGGTYTLELCRHGLPERRGGRVDDRVDAADRLGRVGCAAHIASRYLYFARDVC
jgi:alpha-beta hydrolase superfamily lysophospholipase